MEASLITLGRYFSVDSSDPIPRQGHDAGIKTVQDACRREGA